jgi:hypothetical protein
METVEPSEEPMGIVYQPLREECKEIRLLDVKPARRLDAPLRATIRHVKLHEAEYTALSYVWGQKEHDRSDIEIEYKTTTRQYLASKVPGNSGSPKYNHSIGSSLAKALRHLRRKYHKFTIWADALCINQLDGQEKSWHIGLMRSVYTEAEEVHAWLGPRYNDDVGLVSHVNAAFDLANTVWALAKRITDSQSLLAEKDWLEACFEVASPQQSSDQAQHVWTEFSTRLRHAALSDRSVQNGLSSVVSLSKNNYFARMWILQETGRARKLTFRHGLRHMSHRRILLALGLAHSLRKSQAGPRIEEQLSGWDTRFLGCITARITCAQKRSLLDVLAAAYYSPPPLHQATENEDLVYARLGLADNPVGIEVDCTMSVAEVYTTTARFLFGEGFMDHLVTFKPYRIHQWLSTDYLPSWAYDWSNKGSHAFARYSAARDTSQQVSITPYYNTKFKQVLAMKGFNVGHLLILNKQFSATVTASGLHKKTISWGSLRVMSEPLSVNEKAMLTQTINQEYQRLGVDVTDADIESLFSYRSLPFAYFWCWWLRWAASLIKLLEDADFQRTDTSSSNNNIAELLFREAPEELGSTARQRQFGTRAGLLALVDYQRWSKFLRSGDSENKDSASVEFAESLFRSAWGMRPAVLDTGRVGYVPEDTRSQDQVVIFHGVKAPLVIRKATEDTYTIIGPAHICGVMQGQLMDASLSSNTYKLV